MMAFLIYFSIDSSEREDNHFIRKADQRMKKWVALLLAILLCAVSLSATAELLTTDFSKDEITVERPEKIDLQKDALEDSARAYSSSDSVTNSNGTYRITTNSGATILFDPRGTTFMTLTQSLKASWDVYGLFQKTSDAENFARNMANNNVHIVVWDYYDAFDAIHLETLGSDDLTRAVRNLANLGIDDINTVAQVLAQANGLSNYDLYQFNGNVWIMLTDRILVTIANSEYQGVYYEPTGSSMTSSDYSDFTEFMRSLKIY